MTCRFWFWIGLCTAAREQSAKAYATRAGSEKSTAAGTFLSLYMKTKTNYGLFKALTSYRS